MIRRILIAALIIPVIACGEPTATVAAERFTGSWRSVTAPNEHLRLTIARSLVSDDMLSARITFSGVAWEGPARIEGDSLIMDITTAAISGAAVIAHPGDGGALRVRVESNASAPILATFVRQE